MYNYETERPALFTDEGQRDFLKTRDHVKKLLKTAGALRMQEAMICCGSSWTQLAMIDRLVELNEILEITGHNVAGQHRVFVARGE